MPFRARRHGERAVAIIAGIALVATGVLAGQSAQAVGIASSAADVADATDAHPEFLGKTHYTGEFHAHTNLSDGSLMPEDAFKHVSENTSVDFFTVSPHDVTHDLRNSDDFVEDPEDSESEEWRYVHEATEKFNESSDLITIPAEEVTWYDDSGHINLFNTDWKATAYSKGGGLFATGNMMYDLPTFYARLKLDPDAIAQFNHPGVSKGNFFGFTNLDAEVDERIELMEYKTSAYSAQYALALDKGWHVAPVFNGDEHSPNWVTSNPALTGVWANERSLDGLYSAMHDRSMYASFDENAILSFSANDTMMGSILPADTTELRINVEVTDPDETDAFTSVALITNAGAVAHTFPGVTGREVSVDLTKAAANGDYYYVKAVQADGDEIISAPIWVGETTRGANYAPVISIDGDRELQAQYGESVELPGATATDDSGTTPDVTFTAFNGAGEIPIENGAFTVSSYDDHFVVAKSSDETGSTSAEIIRITVAQDELDADAVFTHFGSVAAVGALPGETGISVVTDENIERAWLQVLPAGEDDWSDAETIASENDTVFEVNEIARAADNYQDSITGQPLRSHEFNLTGLVQGERYQYRFGVSESGGWADVSGEFVSGGEENAPIYMLGDIQISSGDPADYELPKNMLTQLQTQKPGGDLLIQVGDLVDNGGRAQYWTEAFQYLLDDLDLQFSTMVGNHETYGDMEFDDALSTERNAIFSSMYNLPKNGSAVGESSYSYDRGDIHFAVLNSNYDLDTQLDWLVDDMRSTEKKWKVVLGHFPYYGGNHSDDAGMDNARVKVTEVVSQLGVDLYVGGHDHVYKRQVIYDGRLAQTPEEVTSGTTFVTMGSSGPKFYDNDPHWWDSVVYDDDVQTGTVLEVTAEGLAFNAYNIAGEPIDSFTVQQPEGSWNLSSAAVKNKELGGVGFLSYPGSRDTLTVTAVALDYAQENVVDIRTIDVTLDHSGREQYVTFDEPLPAVSSSTVKLFVWDSLGNGEPLIPALMLREGMTGEGTAESPYEITTWNDVEKIPYEPAAHYTLMNDLELDGTERAQIGSGLETFRGVFDGNGHSITGFIPPSIGGGGVFATNEGTIRNLAVVDAAIDTAQKTVGILVDYNTGTIESSWTSGTITGAGRVGGLVGDSLGTVRDSYSTADVRSVSTEAGGVVGVALGSSMTENVYSSGNVTSDARNVGGVVGYGYDGTTVQNVISLNGSVTAPSYAHAVVGRILDGDTAELFGNLASDATFVSAESLADPPAATNLKGQIVAEAETQSVDLYAETLGWNLDDVWIWDDAAQRPLLRGNTEDYVEGTPETPPNENGYYEIQDVDDLAMLAAYPGEKFVLTNDIDLSGVADFTSIGGLVPFAGELDGNGHRIIGLTSTTGGFLNINSGVVRNLGFEGAAITSAAARVGILSNTNGGTIENVYTTGSISGGSRVGGVTGDSAGIVRNVYSTADVHTEATEGGGVVGVALAGSVTENVYASGAVSAGARNIGGVVGYAYTGTEIRNGVALNPSVTAPSYAHRFLGRVLGGNTATLENNYGSDSVEVAVQSVLDPPSTSNLMGGTITARQARDPQFFAETLGWDLAGTWAWNNDAARPTLVSAPEDYTGPVVPPLPEDPAPDLAQDDDGFYLIESGAELAEITAFPAENYRLAGNIDLAGESIPRIAPDGFFGVFDGAGHTISGYVSDAGGLFANNSGTITRLGLVDASVASAGKNIGLLVDNNAEDAIVSEVWTSGAVSGASTVGGIVGYAFGTITDSYSTASVTANAGRQAGGVAGITGRGSVTDRTYATGRIEAVAEQNAGGITGYAYTGTTVQNSFALNEGVFAASQASRVVARVLSGDTASLANNYAVESLVVELETVHAEGPTTQRGETRTVAESQLQETWESGLGWNFESVWAWDGTASRPVLRNANESAGE